MTRLAMALIHGENPVACTTFHKGKGKGPAQTPMVAPAPPVEEASVEIEDSKKKKARTGKSTLKMPLRSSKDTGLKL